jgi:deoxyribodipyrimidine photo-lyase
MRTIVWFRGKDLRVADHAPLCAAASVGEVIPLFVVDPYFFLPERAARLPRRMQFLLDSIAGLAQRTAGAYLKRSRAGRAVPTAHLPQERA